MPRHLVYFCYPAAYSLSFLNHCLRHHGLPIRTVVFSRTAGFEKGRPLGFGEVAAKTIRQSGLPYACYELAFTIGSAALLHLKKSCHRAGPRLMTFGELREAYDLSFFNSRDFNDESTIDFLENQDPDLGLSAFNNQIFRQPLIDWFQGRHGLYNVHPALLPDFRGVEPVLPLLLNQPRPGGVTLHSVEAGIDRGAIHYQHYLEVTSDDSVFSVNHKAWREGSRLAGLLVKDLEAGNAPPRKEQENLPVEFGYCRLPSRKTIGQLRRRGRRLIRFRHLRNLLNDS